MATAGTTEVQKEVETPAQPKMAAVGVGSPISNEAYNVISALHAKLEGLEAYRKYSKDADAELWRELCQIECKAVERLVSQLETIVKNGKLRMEEPGQAH